MLLTMNVGANVAMLKPSKIDNYGLGSFEVKNFRNLGTFGWYYDDLVYSFLYAKQETSNNCRDLYMDVPVDNFYNFYG